MPLNDQQRAKLLEPIHQGRVAQRKGGGGKMLSYVEAWDVRATLIRIFGFGGFCADVIEVIPGQKGVLVGLRLTVFGIGPDGQDVTYTEYGADSADSKDLDDLVKTAASEALKRAATNLGDQFGLSLYNKGSLRPVVTRTLDQPAPPPETQREKAERIAEQINLTKPGSVTTGGDDSE